MSDYITCVRCSKRHPRTSRKGRPPIRCPECARAAELERWRRANRKRNARLRRQAAFGPETPEVAAKVDELAAKVATLSAAGLRDFFYHAANRLGLTFEQVASLVELGRGALNSRGLAVAPNTKACS